VNSAGCVKLSALLSVDLPSSAAVSMTTASVVVLAYSVQYQ